MFDYEDHLKEEGFSVVVGLDEAGRGPLAGPVVACAVALKKRLFISKICDSKKISSLQREKSYQEIYQKAYVGVGIISESVIDDQNIAAATYLAMNNAVTELISKIPPSQRKKKTFNQKVYLLVDGKHFRTELPFSYKTIIKGDEKVFSISCASIVAKVTRDRILLAYDKIYPQYGFKMHKGYATPKHKKALKKFGPSLIHRKSFHWS